MGNQENKGPFYSFNLAYHSMELNKVCLACDQLKFERKREVRSDNNKAVYWVEAVCPHEVCPRLDEVKKGGAHNNA